MSTLDMERICRLCCTIKGDMRALFEQRQEYPLALSQMIYAIVDLKVDANDGLPQKICSQCITSLTKMYTTIQSYRENDLILREQLDRAKSDALISMLEIEEVNVKQEAGEEVFLGSDIEETQATELNILIKNEPLDEGAEQRQLNVTDQNVDVCEQTAVQQNKPITKPKGGLQQSKADDPNRLILPLDEHGEEDQLYPDWMLQDEGDEESDVTDANDAADVWEPKRPGRPKKTNDSKPSKFRRIKRQDPHQLGLRNNMCYVCKSEPHETPTALLLHLADNHMHLLPFTCSECVLETVVLNTVLGLNKHLREHFHPKKCLYCDECFPSKSQVDLHIKELHPSMEDDGDTESTVKCKQCGNKYTSRSSLRCHLRNRHVPVTCEVCGAIFNGAERLRYHRQIVHDRNSGKFDCSFCKKKLSSLKTLQSHLTSFHSNPTQPIKCSYCHKTFCSIKSKKLHEECHIRNPNYKAKKSWVDYYTFLEGQHGFRRKQCKCNICGKVTKKIVEHLQSAHFTDKLDCKICGRIFKQQDCLEKHVAMHTPMEQSTSLQSSQTEPDTAEREFCKEDRPEAVTGDAGLAKTGSKTGRPRRSLRSK